MATQQDLQELLRIFTTGRNKIPMLAAMTRIKALQAASLRSISDIAGADISTLTTILNDQKAATQLSKAAKASLKTPSTSSNNPISSSPVSSKRKRSAYELDAEPLTSNEYEASLSLPHPSHDEEAICATTILTNRAPLVLTFAFQLLKYTMPEQPLSSRLSLAQTVVSVNSRGKARSLGIATVPAGREAEWGSGQPKVRILNREIHVLKRGDYDPAKVEDTNDVHSTVVDAEAPTNAIKEEEPHNKTTIKDESDRVRIDSHLHSIMHAPTLSWHISQPITLKKSTFIARALPVTSITAAMSAITTLLDSNPHLRTASHNVTAYRILPSTTHGQLIESSFDDGESGAGRHILSLLASLNATNVVVVMSRWYGGIFLSTDRWRCMSDVVRDALSQRLRVQGVVGGADALWGLDFEAAEKDKSGNGMPIVRPEGARSYILKAFPSAEAEDVKSEETIKPEDQRIKEEPEDEANPPKKKSRNTKKKSGMTLEKEKETNLALLLGALDLLFQSWHEHIGRDELDRRAWGWYVQVRPDVEGGVAGWGGKGHVRLADILALRRKG